ncbi:ArgR family transcriptional regulator [Enterococcus sp. BWB1-3]|uniref:ArgR family transcriptional regulator n=1 Tax=Enterococcus sp. BWB1-3 TaxID=2787713 RepID=UPI00192234C6|nr:ArgR family transcriptional regulator [Enterococcus sp. BWB1-3]MBL1228455.1 ArgR family transcriptional regulator [Enterococcus sp. BWB1-3]
MNKNDRQKKIKKIIIENEIETQDELLIYLKREGLVITQATISRDMKELNIVKSYLEDGKKRLTLLVLEKNDSELDQKLKKSIKDYTKSIEIVRFIIIIRTIPNGADVIANYMDKKRFSEVTATIAGYDTLIVITNSDKDAEKFCVQLNTYINQ